MSLSVQLNELSQSEHNQHPEQEIEPQKLLDPLLVTIPNQG